MLRFLAPIWLAALAALAVPLVLHLWNRRPTRVVRIGSLRGLAGPHGPRALGRRLDDLPLLLLRMAVLGAVVIGLAGLAVRESPDRAGRVDLLLIDPELLRDSLAVFGDSMVDSLRRSGTPIHLLSAGFPALGESAVSGAPSRVWPLLRQLDDSLPPGSRVRVLVSQRAGQFGAVRPALNSHYLMRSAGAGVTSRILADRPVDTLSLQVFVGDGFERDGRAALAAWATAAEAHAGALPRMQLRHVRDADGASDASIIIWLADQSVPEFIRERVADGAVLVQYADGEAAETGHPSLAPASTSAAAETMFHESVWLRTDEPEGSPILVDPSGSAVLTVNSHGGGRHYRIATRFNEEWSTLAMGADLPEIALLTLRGLQTGVDAAPVWPGQAAPRTADPDSPTPMTWTALTTWAVLLATVLLLAERLMSHNRRRMQSA